MRGTALCLCAIASLLASCGSVGPEAGPADAGIDADLGGDATIVTESALFGGAAGARVADIDIISNLPDNTILATAKTDAAGTATIRVYPGGSVTAIYKHTVDMGADLITWVGVKPGETLVLGNRNPSVSGHPNATLGNQTYTWPMLPAATLYRVFTGCNGGVGFGSATLMGTLNEFPSCHRDPMVILFGAFDGATLLNYGLRSNVTFAAGGTVALSTWTAAANATINITGLPPEVTSVNGNFRSVLSPIADFAMVQAYSGTPTGGAFTAEFRAAPIGLRTTGALNLIRTGFRNMILLDSFSANTLTQTVASPQLPPWGQGFTLVSSALQRATWLFVTDEASVADGQNLRVNWNHVSSGTAHPHQWDFILPPDQTSVDFPTLPAQFVDNVPAPQDSISAFNRVFDIASVNGFDALRSQPSANLMCLECSIRTADFQRVVFTQL